MMEEDHVQRILESQNHYTVLQIPSNATDAQIKASYKRIALLVHEDKNHAPGAKEAMAKVNEAKVTLTNPEARREYNLLIAMEEFLANIDDASQQNEARVSDENGDDDDDDDIDVIRVEDGSFSYKQTSYIRNRRTYPRNNKADSNENTFEEQQASEPKSNTVLKLTLVIVAIFVVFAIGLMVIPNESKHSNLSQNPQSIYSFAKSETHTIQRRTIALKIQYFVTTNFSEQLHDHFGGSLGGFERTVKDDYKAKLIDACQRQKKHGIYISCKELKQLFGMAY